MGGKKKYSNIFGSFTEPFNYRGWSHVIKKDWTSWNVFLDYIQKPRQKSSNRSKAEIRRTKGKSERDMTEGCTNTMWYGFWAKLEAAENTANEGTIQKALVNGVYHTAHKQWIRKSLRSIDTLNGDDWHFRNNYSKEVVESTKKTCYKRQHKLQQMVSTRSSQSPHGLSPSPHNPHSSPRGLSLES